MKNELLLIPDKPDIERDAIAKIWEEQGGEVQRIAKFWIKPAVGDKRVSIYGYDNEVRGNELKPSYYKKKGIAK